MNRSASFRESACVWAGRVKGAEWVAEKVVFHHHLCDDVGCSYYLELSETAKFKLYRDLAAQDLELISLLHTHPADWVGLSSIDQRNQITSCV